MCYRVMTESGPLSDTSDAAEISFSFRDLLVIEFGALRFLNMIELGSLSRVGRPRDILLVIRDGVAA